MSLFTRKAEMVRSDKPGRAEPMTGLGPHRALGTPMVPPFPDGTQQAIFGMGCFWGAEGIIGFGRS